MSDEGIKMGDVVQLKSGGPKMTVVNMGLDEMTGHQTAWVNWFEGSISKSDSFPLFALDKVPAGGKFA